MPRKTNHPRQHAAGDVLASMRPRPDAAENETKFGQMWEAEDLLQ